MPTTRTSVNKIDSGVLLTLDNQVDTTTGTVKGRATFVNKTSSLFPNQFVNTRLLVNTLHNATLIPTSTIQHNGTSSFVYVIQGDGKGQQKAQEKPVKTLVSEANTTAVQGINPGDVLANSSFDKLAPGFDHHDLEDARRRKHEWESSSLSPSRPFILRPVATCLLMAAILLVGIVAYTQLPVSALPEVDYPTIQVLTFYPGASPDVVATTVTAPLERQLGQLQGLSQMTSRPAPAEHPWWCCSQPESQHRHRRRRGAIGHQRLAELLAREPPIASHLQQDESSRCAGAHTRDYVK